MRQYDIKKIITCLIILGFLGFFQPGVNVLADQGESVLTYSFQIHPFEIVEIEDGSMIQIEDFGRLLIPGKPNIPSKIFSIAIQPGSSITDITFTYDGYVELPGSYNISPCQQPQIIGENEAEANMNDVFESNYQEVYSSDEAYPSEIGDFLQYSHYRGYDMVDIRINPFTYYPLSGSLIYYPEITVQISYEETEADEKEVEDSLKRTESIAETILYNYDEAKGWYQVSEPLSKGIHDYVIITIDSLVSSVTPLVEWETFKGRNVEVVSLSWITSTYSGYDTPEKIRNFLRDKYPSSMWGIEDVLLVGHYDDVPMRRCAQNVGYGEPETDYYYAELSLPDDESWDEDNDHQYGENSDPIDYYAEVTVGRIPSSDPIMVSSICNKTVSYEQEDDISFKQNILLLGAFFWADTDNAELMEEIAGQSWMTNWTKTRLYEIPESTYSCDEDLTYDNVESEWSTGTYAFVNWAGHGSPTACNEYFPSRTFVNTATCDSLNDAYPSIIFADACSNHDTDEYNIGQAMMEQGAIGFLGSTKVAYGCPGWDDPMDGSSQSLDYYFTTRVTSGDYTTGQAHQMALTEMYVNGLWSSLKYETFEWGAYLGNPHISMSLPILECFPTSLNFGYVLPNETISKTFEIWNEGMGVLDYQIIENCSWVSLDNDTGTVIFERDTITVTINTTGLSPGAYHYEMEIISDGGDLLFGIYCTIPNGTERIDADQSIFNRGFPIRHAVDGDWAGAQSFLIDKDLLTRVNLYLRKFGSPEFNLTVELHKGAINGEILDIKNYAPEEISSSWVWFNVDFANTNVSFGTDYFIVIPPAPSGVTTSFGYEWGYAFGDEYPFGSFWFTRDGGGLWRDLPGAYEFTFQTYGVTL